MCRADRRGRAAVARELRSIPAHPQAVRVAPPRSGFRRGTPAAVRAGMTIGQLISNLYSKYERDYQDETLAVVATQVTVDELLRARRHLAKRARPVAARSAR
jgi:hypothetical protein